MSRQRAILYLVIAAIFWSTSGIVIQYVDMNPLAIAGLRSGLAAVVIFLYLGKVKFTINKNNILGAISCCILTILFIAANKLTSSANAILLQFTSPIWLIFISFFVLKQKIHRRDVVTIFFVFIGIILFFMSNLSGGHLLGNFIAILSGMAMALMVIFMKNQKEGSTLEIILLGNILTFLVCLPSVPSVEFTTTNILGILFLGIIQLGLGYVFYGKAIKHVSALEAILIPVIEPLLNPFWVFVFTSEIPNAYVFIGGFIVITAIVTRSIIDMKELQIEDYN